MKVVINWTRCCHKPHHDKPQQAFARRAGPSTIGQWPWLYGYTGIANAMHAAVASCNLEQPT